MPWGVLLCFFLKFASRLCIKSNQFYSYIPVIMAIWLLRPTLIRLLMITLNVLVYTEWQLSPADRGNSTVKKSNELGLAVIFSRGLCGMVQSVLSHNSIYIYIYIHIFMSLYQLLVSPMHLCQSLTCIRITFRDAKKSHWFIICVYQRCSLEMCGNV